MELRVAAHGSPEYEDAVELRRRVLRVPLGLDFSRDELESERNDEHLVAVDAESVIGVAVLTPVSPNTAKMRQVAVDPERQGEGIGKALVRFFEDRCLANGYCNIVLHARIPAVRFYEQLGYSVDGDEFEEVSIPHRVMKKTLYVDLLD